MKVSLRKRGPQTRRHRTAFAALLALSLASCSSSGASDSKEQEATAELNVVDAMFVDMMLPHHEQAIVMADMALEPSRGAGARRARQALANPMWEPGRDTDGTLTRLGEAHGLSSTAAPPCRPANIEGFLAAPFKCEPFIHRANRDPPADERVAYANHHISGVAPETRKPDVLGLVCDQRDIR